MSDERSTSGVRYFDVAAATIALLVIGGLAGAPVRASGTIAGVRPIVLFACVGVAFGALRQQAYRRHHWLIASCAATLLAALAHTFRLWPVMWFALAMTIGLAALMVGLAAPTRRIREPLSRLELFKLAALVTSGVLTIAATEGVLRLMPGIFGKEMQQVFSVTPSNSGVGDPYIGHLHRPSRRVEVTGKDFDARHSTDGLGFRNPWPWPRQSDIVAVGDSLTFGLGVEDGEEWPAIVTRLTGEPVLNLGLVGAGPQQYFRLYERYGSRQQPTLVLVGMYAQNDFWDADLFDRWLREGVGDNYLVWRDFGRPLRYDISLRHPLATAEGLFRTNVYPVLRTSYLYNLLSAIQAGAGRNSAAAKHVDFPDGGRLQLDEADFVTKTAGAQANHREFRLVLDALRQIHALAAEHGARTLVILQPGKEEVYLPVMGETIVDPTIALRRALDEAGIEYLDLGPIFRERATAGERLFFEVDTHPNRSGYALIGESVAAHIVRHREYGLAR